MVVVGAFSSRAKIFGRMFDNSFPACAVFVVVVVVCFFVSLFRSGDQLAYTYSNLYARISPQWLSELRRL